MLSVTPDFLALQQQINRWRWWLRLQMSITWGIRGLLCGLALGLGISLAARIAPLWDWWQLLALTSGCGVIGGALGGLYGILKKLPHLQVARYVDANCQLHESASAALELQSGAITAPTREWVEKQWTQAARAARNVEIHKQIPLQFSLRELLIASLFMLAIALSLWLPNLQLKQVAEQRATEQAIAAEIEKIEALKESILGEPALTEAQKEALTQPLDSALEKLNSDNLTKEQAVSTLTQAQIELQQLANPQDLQNKQNSFETLGSYLAENQSTANAAQSMQSQQLAQAAEQLRNTDLSSLSAEQQAQLAEQLEAAATAVAENNPALAEQLRQTASDLRAGNLSAAQAGLENIAQALDETAQQQAAATAASQAAAQLAQSGQQIAQAGTETSTGENPNGQTGQNGQGTPIGNNTGNNGENGQNGQNGNGQNGQNGNEQNGQNGQNGQLAGGSGSGTGSGQSEQGGVAGTQPISQGNGPGDGGLSGYEQIFAPSRLGGTDGTQVQVDSNNNGEAGNEINAQRPSDPNNTGEANIPYTEVLPDYSAAANRAIESEQVPPGLRGIVRDYFSSLEP